MLGDGLPLHGGVDTMRWNGGHPRFHFVPLPKAAAGLTLIEGFWTILSQRALAGRHCTSTEEVDHAVHAGVSDWNRQPTPFLWGRPPKPRRQLKHTYVYRICGTTHLELAEVLADIPAKLDDLLIFLRQKTPPFRAGDEWRSSSPWATLPAYRRACGNLRLWSGADNQGPNERVSRSQRFAFGRACLVRCVQPRNPLPLGMGRGQRAECRAYEVSPAPAPMASPGAG